MRAILLLLLLASYAGLASAEVFKSIGPNGRVQYTDRPVSGAQAVRIRRDQRSTPINQASGSPAFDDLGPYTAFEIVTPEPNATVRNDTGDLAVSLMLSPALMPEHKLELFLDGERVPGKLPGTQLTLKGLVLGSHRLRAQVVDEQGAPIASTAPLTFHLRKPFPRAALP